MSIRIRFSHLIKIYQNAVFKTVKSIGMISLFETVKLSFLISLRSH